MSRLRALAHGKLMRICGGDAGDGSVDIYKRVLSGAFWSGVAAALSKCIVVLASFVLARCCGKEVLGQYGMVIGTVTMLATFSGMGMGQTVVKYVAQYRKSNPDRASAVLALSSMVTTLMAVMIGGAFFLCSGVMAERILADANLTCDLRMSVPAVVFTILNEVQLSSLSGCEAYRDRSMVMCVSGIIQGLSIIVGGAFFGLHGAVIAYSITMFVLFALTSIVVRKVWCRNGLRRNWSGMREIVGVLFSFSLPTLLLLMLGAPVTWLTNALLANQPNGYDALGLINATSYWQGMVVFFVSVACVALVPVVSDVVGKGDSEAAILLVRRTTIGSALVVVPACVVLMLASPLVLAAYGEAFKGETLAFCLLIAFAGLTAVCVPMFNCLVGAGKMWLNLIVILIAAVLQVWTSLVLVKYGAVGLAASRVIVGLFDLVALLVVFWGPLRISWRSHD